MRPFILLLSFLSSSFATVAPSSQAVAISDTKPAEVTCAGPYCWETILVASQTNPGCVLISTKVWVNEGGSPGTFVGNFTVEANCDSGQLAPPSTAPSNFPEGLWGMPEFQSDLSGIIDSFNKGKG